MSPATKISELAIVFLTDKRLILGGVCGTLTYLKLFTVSLHFLYVYFRVSATALHILGTNESHAPAVLIQALLMQN